MKAILNIQVKRSFSFAHRLYKIPLYIGIMSCGVFRKTRLAALANYNAIQARYPQPNVV